MTDEPGRTVTSKNVFGELPARHPDESTAKPIAFKDLANCETIAVGFFIFCSFFICTAWLRADTQLNIAPLKPSLVEPRAGSTKRLLAKRDSERKTQLIQRLGGVFISVSPHNRWRTRVRSTCQDWVARNSNARAID